MKSILEKAGYQVACARNGTEGIFEFSIHSFDGVLLEYDLPDVSGSFAN